MFVGIMLGLVAGVALRSVWWGLGMKAMEYMDEILSEGEPA